MSHAAAHHTQFTDLLQPEQGRLLRLARNFLANEEDARDALQESVIRAHLAFPRLRGGPGAFGAWLRRIVINECFKIHRRRARVIPVAEPTVGADPAPGPAAAGDVWDAVQRLSPRYRSVIILRFGHDMRVRDVATALRIPAGTVKSRLNAALRQLRMMLADSEDRPRGYRFPA